MKRVVKHIVLMITGGLGLLPVLLSLLFLVKQHRIKEQMEKELEKQYLQTITVPVQELHWIEEGKEVKIGGELFDVKTWFVQNNLATLTGLFDEKEKSLYRQLENQINRQPGSDNAGNFLFAFTAFENYFPNYQYHSFLQGTCFCLLPTPPLSTGFTALSPLPPNI